MDVKTFLDQDEIRDLIAENNLEAVYGKCNHDDYLRCDDCRKLTQYLLRLGINPFDYFKNSIPDKVFAGCSSLTSIDIPDSVTRIGDSAFFRCDSLTSVTFGDNSQLTTIGGHAFYACDNLTSISIPDSVTRTGWYVFACCANLTAVTIGSGMIIIGQHAFRHCTSLTDITFNGTKEQWKKVRKNQGWRTGAPIKVIHCTDGDIKLK